MDEPVFSIEFLLRGVDLFNAREYYEAHEVWELAWRAAGPEERFFYQSLIHVAAGCFHWETDNPAGAVLQWGKGIRKLAGYLPSWQGIDTRALYWQVEACLERARHGDNPEELPQVALTLESLVSENGSSPGDLAKD